MTASRYIILFPGRTGGSHLQQLLRSHPAIICEPECLVKKSESFQKRWLISLYEEERQPGIQAVGFKTKLKDVVNVAEFKALLEKHSVFVIYMWRENVVKQAFSRINARRLYNERGLWNLHEEHPPLPPMRVSIPQFEEALEHHIIHKKKLEEFIKELPLPVYRLRYEDLVGDEAKVVGEILRNLKVELRPLRSPLKKVTSDRLEAAFTNYQEIKQHYYGSELWRYFD
jgi:LPS sulfotransferase NodH